MAFPVMRQLLFSVLRRSGNLTFNNIKDELLLLTYIKLLNSETKTDKPNFEIVPVVSKGDDFYL